MIYYMLIKLETLLKLHCSLVFQADNMLEDMK